MSYTLTELQNSLIIINCCKADLGFAYIKAELMNKPKKCIYNKLLYLNGITCTLNRYIEQFEESTQYLTEDQITNILETCNQICGCNCCKDQIDLMKDINNSYL